MLLAELNAPVYARRDARSRVEKIFSVRGSRVAHAGPVADTGPAFGTHVPVGDGSDSTELN